MYGLVRQLPQVAPEHEYFLYSNKEIDADLPGISVHSETDRAFAACPGTLWLWGRGGKFVRRDRLDAFWSSSASLPGSVPASVLKLVTVYDLAWLHFPETMSRYNLFVHRIFAEKAIRRADLIVAISRSTAEDLIQFLDVPAEKIKLVYPGISEQYKPRDPLQAAEYISRKYNVSPRYMAAVGTVEPRKNLTLLVRAMGILKNKGQIGCPLLISGGKGWKNTRLFQEIESAGLTENEIRFLGYLPDEDLPLFYAGSQVFLFPSLYEGFGLPPLEAMACGTPAVASDAKCMPEVLGDAAILVPPTDAEGFAAAIARLSLDGSLRRSLRIAGICQAEKFRWEDSVKQLLDAFEGNVGDSVKRAESYGR